MVLRGSLRGAMVWTVSAKQWLRLSHRQLGPTDDKMGEPDDDDDDDDDNDDDDDDDDDDDEDDDDDDENDDVDDGTALPERVDGLLDA